MGMFYDQDADKKILESKTIAIIGYGSQGHAQAQNLRDSGYQVVVADIEGSDNWKLAESHKFQPLSAEQASEKADIIQILVPDDIQKKLFDSTVSKHLSKGKALVFSHGFNIHFNQIVPPPGVDVYMVAPKGPGHIVRRMYEQGQGVPALIAVQQDASGQAKQTAITHACGIGAGRAGIIETTFAEETETDLFGEQTVLCGGVTELIRAGFDTLVEAGYQPEIAYFECCNELKLIVDLIFEKGLQGMYYSVSDTAEYGGLSKGPVVINQETKKRMQEILQAVQDGSFAQEWITENEKGRPVMEKFRTELKESTIEKVGKKLREMMSWV
jgi:ketol-acid reductoisomerase